MKNLQAKINTLISQVEPMRHQIKSLRMIAQQHSNIGEETEANECTKEANQIQLQMEKANKQLDTLMAEYKAMQEDTKDETKVSAA